MVNKDDGMMCTQITACDSGAYDIVVSKKIITSTQ